MRHGPDRPGGQREGWRRWAWSLAVAAGLAVSLSAQMPNLAEMSGTPLPASDLPTGTVSIRVVRGDLANNAAGVEVTLHDGVRTLSARTDENGRSSFEGLRVGASVHAHATVDGQELQTATFPMPAAGGVRLILVAGLPETASAAQGGEPTAGGAAPAPAEPGTVVLGGQSRFLVEVTDDGLDVYLLFDVVNGSGHAVSSPPVVIGVPDVAQALTVLETSSPQVAVEGRQFVLRGPFAPGVTPIQVAYRIVYASGSLAFSQPLPLAMPAPAVLVRRIPGVAFRSPQATSVREVSMQDGTPFLLASGQSLQAGSQVQFAFENLPHHSSMPRLIALALAAVILGAGAWLAVAGPGPEAARARAALETKREALLEQLVALERRRREGGHDSAQLEQQREALLARLERVYAQLDAMNTLPEGVRAEGQVAADAGVAGARAAG